MNSGCIKKVTIYCRISKILRSYHTAELTSVAQFALIHGRVQVSNSIKKRLQYKCFPVNVKNS